MKFTNIFSLMLTLTISLPAFALSSMKPGLWEHSFTIKSQDGKLENAMTQMKAQLEKMPSDQRKMMEGMMAKQGMGISQNGSSVKVCLSKEQAEKLDIPHNQKGDCKQEVLKRTSKSVKMKFSCTGNPSTSGEGEFTLSSPTAYTGKTVVDTVSNGKKDHLEMNQKGKWLSADCGNIQPAKTK